MTSISTKTRTRRPLKYKPEYIQLLIDYFNIDLLVKDKHTGKLVPNDLPFLVGFLDKLNINHDTFYKWCKRYKEFNAAYKKAQEYNARRLTANALKQRWSIPMAIFAQKNLCGWRDRQDITSGDDPLKFQGVIIERAKGKGKDKKNGTS